MPTNGSWYWKRAFPATTRISESLVNAIWEAFPDRRGGFRNVRLYAKDKQRLDALIPSLTGEDAERAAEISRFIWSEGPIEFFEMEEVICDSFPIDPTGPPA